MDYENLKTLATKSKMRIREYQHDSYIEVELYNCDEEWILFFFDIDGNCIPCPDECARCYE